MVPVDHISCGRLRLPSSVVILAAAVLFPAALVRAEVKIVGKVSHVGFPCGAVDLYRRGYWCPAVVTLKNVGTENVAGRLVLRQRDKDGDVMVAETVVSLTAGSEARPYRLDFVSNEPSAAGTFSVGLYHEETGRPIIVYDENGNPHEALPAPQAADLSPKATLILDLSRRPLSVLDTLADRSGDLLKQPLEVVRFPPEELPDRWYALQAAQAIVWDAPDLRKTVPQQTRALIDYVRAGGILVVAAGKTADELAKSSLGEILPATMRGTRQAEVLALLTQQVYARCVRLAHSTPPGATGHRRPMSLHHA